MNLLSSWDDLLNSEVVYEARVVWAESKDLLAEQVAELLNTTGGYGASCTTPVREDGAGVYDTLVLYKVRKKKNKND